MIRTDDMYQQQNEIMFTKNNRGPIELVRPRGSESSHPYPFMLLVLVNSDIRNRPNTYSFPR
jgi:hypothetical protein